MRLKAGVWNLTVRPADTAVAAEAVVAAEASTAAEAAVAAEAEADAEAVLQVQRPDDNLREFWESRRSVEVVDRILEMWERERSRSPDPKGIEVYPDPRTMRL
jgi:hypothetical protein